MANGKIVTLYQYYFSKGTYRCTQIEAVETAKQYKLILEKFNRWPTYKIIVKKEDLDKIAHTSMAYEMFSTEPKPKLFMALLWDIYKSNRVILQQQIAEIDKEMQIIATIN